MNVKFYVRAVLCLYLSLPLYHLAAQELKVGDALPPELWNMPLQVVNHSEGKKIITLSEYKNTLIILDFWATWCGPCIKSLNELDSLQKEFSGKLTVIPITYEVADKIRPVFSKYQWGLPSVYADTTLKAYFPHRSIPHQVWIKDNKVLVVTGLDPTIYANLYKAIKGEELEIEEVISSLPVIDFYNSVITSYRQDKGVRTKINKEEVYMYNQSIGSIYTKLYKDIIHWSGRFNRVISEIPDTLLFKVFQPVDYLPGRAHPENLSYDKWKTENAYCYVLQIPQSKSLARTLNLARVNFNSYMTDLLGIFARIEQRKVNCLVMIDLKQDIPRESGSLPPLYQFDEINLSSFTFQNIPFSHFFGVFREQNWVQELPVIDLTGYKGKITAKFDSKLTDIKVVRSVLREHGFDLVERELELDMLVIKTSL